jgi:hypothetical protein
MIARMRRTIVVLSLCLAAAVAQAAPSTPTQPPATSLDKARVDAASKAYTLYESQFRAGISTAEAVYEWSRRWCEADGCATKLVLEGHFQRMKSLEALVSAKYAGGMANGGDKAAAEYYRVEADLWLQRGKGP